MNLLLALSGNLFIVSFKISCKMCQCNKFISLVLKFDWLFNNLVPSVPSFLQFKWINAFYWYSNMIRYSNMIININSASYWFLLVFSPRVLLTLCLMAICMYLLQIVRTEDIYSYVLAFSLDSTADRLYVLCKILHN